MADLRHDNSGNLLNISGQAAVDAMSRRLPVVFVNEGNTVTRCTGLLRDGYSVVLLVDLPGYRDRGTQVRLFGRGIWVPSGCRWIYEAAGVNAASVFSYAAAESGPYEVAFAPLSVHPAPLDLQTWADTLEAVLRISPESWIGWFLLEQMWALDNGRFVPPLRGNSEHNDGSERTVERPQG
jgi:hypothetical protein